MGGMSRFLLKWLGRRSQVPSLCGLGLQFKIGADGVPGPMGQYLSASSSVMVQVSATRVSKSSQPAAIDGFFGKLDRLLGCERIG
jgi:hypothetical protein